MKFVSQGVNKIKRGDIVIANLNSSVGCIQQGVRPILILQNDVGNHFSPTSIGVAISSKNKKALHLPVHVLLDNNDLKSGFLKSSSVILLEQIMTIDKKQFIHTVASVKEDYLANKIIPALKCSLGI